MQRPSPTDSITGKVLRVLFVEDDEVDRLAFERMLTQQRLPYDCTMAGSVSEAKQRLLSGQFDVIIANYSLGDGVACDILKLANDTPVIVCTGAGDEEIAVEAMKSGAYDYLLKDQNRKYLTVLPSVVQNVLKRKDAEDQFGLFSQALLKMADSVCIADSDGRIAFVDRTLGQLFGYDDQELVGRHISVLYAESNRQDIAEVLSPLSSEWRGKLLGKKKNGKSFLVFWSSFAISNGTNKKACIGISIRDISKQKQTIDEFNKDDQPEGRATKILLVEDDLIDQMAFKRMVTQQGLPIEFEIAQSVADAKDKLTTGKFDIVITDYSLGDGVAFDVLELTREMPVIVITGEGDEEIAVKAMKEGVFDYLVKDPQRNYLKTMPVLVENAIKSKNREKRFRMLSHALMSISDSVWITDLDGKIVFVNEAFLQTYGYERPEIIDKTIDVVFSEDNPSELFQRLHDGTLQNGLELLCQKKNGEELPVFVSTSIVYDEFGIPLAYTGVAKDITEQKQARIDLQNAKELAVSANQAKSEFLANMSHEIRTPMNSILGMTELTLDTELNEDQREYLEIVRQSTESLLTVINDILDFSKIGAGKLELDDVNFSLHNILHELLKTFGLPAYRKRLELVNYVAPEIPDKLVGDPVRLRQILVNLIGNAVKFTERGFVDLQIRTEWRTDDQICLHFMLTDTGLGIPDDRKAHIFRSFEQADGSTSRKYGGTGLGLAISNELVKMMSGEMWVESPVDFASDEPESDEEMGQLEIPDFVGSRFHFTAVFKIQLEQPAFLDKDMSTQLSGLRVLVVDNNRTTRRYLRDLLLSWKCSPSVSANKQDVLNKLGHSLSSQTPFDVVILDTGLPDRGAFEVCDHIQHAPVLQRATIVPMTAVFDPDEKSFLEHSGLGYHVTKPVYPPGLARTLLVALGTLDDSGNARDRQGSGDFTPLDKKLRVLLADDNPSNQKLATHLLTKQGHIVTVVNNGKEVLEKYDDDDFDLILMDIQMPVMDGFQAIRLIRDKEKSGTKHVPTIALTANAMKGYRERCLAAGFNGYVSKPIRRKELFRVIQGVYGEQPAA